MTEHKSHRPHTPVGPRVRNQSEIRDMVDRVMEAKHGTRFLMWLRSVRKLGGIENLPGQRIELVETE